LRNAKHRAGAGRTPLRRYAVKQAVRSFNHRSLQNNPIGAGLLKNSQNLVVAAVLIDAEHASAIIWAALAGRSIQFPITAFDNRSERSGPIVRRLPECVKHGETGPVARKLEQ